MITIIDYGLSNMLSIRRAVELFEKDVLISNKPEDVLRADKIILPGVGAFQYGMEKLNELGLADAIKSSHSKNVPIMGICLGMQMLFDYSEEGGKIDGLGIVHGSVTKIDSVDINGEEQDVPHIGWKRLRVENIDSNNSLFEGVPDEAEMYFVHSYAGKTLEKSDTIAYASYGGRDICAMVKKGNTIGCQFHPEKSGKYGLEMLGNFISKQ